MQQITALEDLSHRDTYLNQIEPTVKIVITLMYIIAVISYGSMEINGLLLFACIPVFLLITGEIPLKPLLIRAMVALPFSFFAGLSNLILDRKVIITIGNFRISEGMVSFTTLMLKTILTVMVVLLLIATTKMNDLIYALVTLHIPSLIVIQLMMTYRYMGVLLKEASLMYHAYLLRAPGVKGIKLSDMGAFLGQLILRSIDRAERIYHAMQCRGFEGEIVFTRKSGFGIKNWLLIILTSFVIIALRIGNLDKLFEILFMM